MSAKKPTNRTGGVVPTVSSFLFLWMSRILVTVVAILVYPIARLTQPRTPVPRKSRHLLIGAGVKGWELIEYQEIFASAREYLGVSNVSRLSFSGRQPVLVEFHEGLRELRPSHYYFDPRSGSQRPLTGLWEALVIGFLLERYRVTPICAVTDFPLRRWRLQAALVSARSGVVTSLMSPAIAGPWFPHSRIVGPMPFPLSVATLRALQERKGRKQEKWRGLRDTVVFVGMLHEPRKTVIENIKSGLAKHDIPMEIIGRMPGGSRITDDDYWGILSNARLVVSTSSQMSTNGTELIDRNHFIYRFIETTAAGTALAIGAVEGSEHLLQPDVDYIAYSSVDEAVAKIASAWHSPTFLTDIAQSGSDQANAIIKGEAYWGALFPKSP
jgi:hypothetical protein